MAYTIRRIKNCITTACIVLIVCVSFIGSLKGQQVWVPDSIEVRVRQYFDGISDQSPGFSTLVAVDGKIIYQKTMGSADLEHSVPITANTLFNIGSVSKQFTAFIILLLEEEGKLNIDDRVSKYLPQYRVFRENDIRIKHLLYHTSGLRERLTMLQLGGWKDDDVYSSADTKYLLIRQEKLNFSPGTMRQYCNTNYFVLALVAEALSGKKFSEYCKEKIFIPLDMQTAVVAYDHQMIIPDKAIAYNTIKKENRIKYTPSDDDYGDEGIYCTIADLKKWADNFKEKRIGTKKIYDKFFAHGKFDNGKEIPDYGYGWFHDTYKGSANVWHDGSRLGFRTGFIYYPDKNTYIITLCNARDFPYVKLREKIAAYLFQNQVAPVQTADVPVTPLKPFVCPPEQMKKYTGLYWDRIGDQTLKIYLKNDTLYADNYTMVPENEHSFRLKNGTTLTGTKLLFTRKGTTSVWGMTRISGRAVSFKDNNNFDYEWVDPVKNINASEFTGSFYSSELDVKFEIQNRKDTLEVNIRGYEDPIKMVCRFKDYFSDPDFGGLYFQRDKNRKITGYLFIHPKVNNALFRKIHY